MKLCIFDYENIIFKCKNFDQINHIEMLAFQKNIIIEYEKNI